MPEINDIWAKSGTHTYPRLMQTSRTCVFVSVAGAVNYLAGLSITEQQMLKTWVLHGRPPVHFGSAIKCLESEINDHSITVDQYHDGTNLLQSADTILDQLRNGAVLIPSLQVATWDGNQAARVQEWHMISVFDLKDGIAQVWDTNGRSGSVTEPEIRAFLAGECSPIPFSGSRYLVSHDQHEAVVFSKPNGA